MAFVHRLFLSLPILLMVLHPGAAHYAPQKSQEEADALADSLAAWQKDGLELLDEPGVYVKANGLRKSPVIKHRHNSTEMAEEVTKQDPNGHEHIESIFCRGAGCMIGLVIVLVAVPAGILMGSLAICWWCERKRRLSGDQQERTGLITGSNSQTNLPEPALH
ncbi:hypothetical protein DUI87_15809 [Hirundo rustica rustica]|uniref:Uncharacterized protein n=1 Tax=Hirundo rustica rustica TaxID=333673 RepID=A0A3M0JZH9_HIRRU|nr:hypothetical protein DUI87_15809 [Hirundo rustica rustica]